MTTSGDNTDIGKQLGSFFRRQSTKVKQKYEDTDFKGGANDLGKSISAASKKAGSKISEGFKEMKESEKTQNAKRGFMRFATKVKGLFSSSSGN